MNEFMGKNLPEEINNLDYYRDCHLTIGNLRKFLNDNPNLDDDALVLIERVEDFYYQIHGWSVVRKKGDMYYMTKKLKDIGEPISEDELMDSMAQYTPAWSIFRYNDDKKDVYISLHY